MLKRGAGMRISYYFDMLACNKPEALYQAVAPIFYIPSKGGRVRCSVNTSMVTHLNVDLTWPTATAQSKSLELSATHPDAKSRRLIDNNYYSVQILTDDPRDFEYPWTETEIEKVRFGNCSYLTLSSGASSSSSSTSIFLLIDDPTGESCADFDAGDFRIENNSRSDI